MNKRPNKRRTLATIRKEVNAAKRRIAAERDKLRALLEEIETIADTCDDAVEDLGRAVDSLSQYL